MGVYCDECSQKITTSVMPLCCDGFYDGYCETCWESFQNGIPHKYRAKIMNQLRTHGKLSEDLKTELLKGRECPHCKTPFDYEKFNYN